MVPRRRLELPRPCGHRYLKPARLPIPPPGQGCGPGASGIGVGARCSARAPAASTGAGRLRRNRGVRISWVAQPLARIERRARQTGAGNRSHHGDAERGDGVRRLRLHRPLRGQAAGRAGLRGAGRGARPRGGAVPQADGRGRPDRAAVRLGGERGDGGPRGRGRRRWWSTGRHPGRAAAGDFQRVHAEGAGARRARCRRRGRARLVHVSAIGADPASPSRYARPRARASRRCARRSRRRRSCGPRWCSGRRTSSSTASPRWRRCCPFMPVICGRHPVSAGLCRRRGGRGDGRAGAARTRPGATYELGGPRVWTFRELLAYMLHETGGAADGRYPDGLGAAAGAACCELLPGKLFTPRSVADAAARQRRRARRCRGWSSWASCRRRWNWSCRDTCAATGPEAASERMLPEELKGTESDLHS